MSTALLVPTYPKFTLRSSLIDQDPVIWAHLAHSYIQLCTWLLGNNLQHLNVKAKQALYLFLKSYLHETCDEESKIFSLGAINPDIRSNEAALKNLVFQLVKAYSILKLNLLGESIWHFISIYKDAPVVRGLVDGTFKSKFNDNKKSGNISSIGSVQAHILHLLTSNKLTTRDLDNLSQLLGQNIKRATTVNLSSGNSAAKTVNKKNSVNFAAEFVSGQWIEDLEKLYSDGKSIHSKMARSVMVVSLISLSPSKLAKLAGELGIRNLNSMVTSPLFSSIILSNEFRELVPVETNLPFITQFSYKPIDPEHVATLQSMFPEISESRAKALLQDDSVDVVINKILETPELIIDSEAEPEPEPFKPGPVSEKAKARFADDNFVKVTRKKSIDMEQLRQANLTSALRMMYESDEDEPDDTYAEQGATRSEVEAHSVISPTEEYLFAAYKQKGGAMFDKNSRKSADRAAMKKQTSWSDEQIEGWMRMLVKSPKRFQLMEESYLYGRGNPNRAGSVELSNKNTASPAKTDARTFAYNEKNKAHTANHNRKRNHDKKNRAELP